MSPKAIAAKKAVEYVKDGMTVGLGSGSTAAFAIEAFGEFVKNGLSVQAVASSVRSEALAKKAGIQLVPFSEINIIDLYIDGADEIDGDFNLMKGGGGALLREKLLASNSARFIVVADNSKLVSQLGKFPLAVEIVPFGFELTSRQVNNLDCKVTLRKEKNIPFVTDNGNYILDCHFKTIPDIPKLSQSLNAIPGVVENGLFLNAIVDTVIVGFGNGEVKVLSKK